MGAMNRAGAFLRKSLPERKLGPPASSSPGTSADRWATALAVAIATFWLSLTFPNLWANLAANQAQPKKDLPEPEVLALLAPDGIELSATYYAPKVSGKDTPVVILLHMYGSDQRDWGDVAEELQKRGLAAVTLDLRGHGGSKKRQGGKEFEYKNLGRDGFLAMVTQDMEALKRELIIRHNRGEINIERLGIVGAEMGATVAMLWARWDWTNAGGERNTVTRRAEDYRGVRGGTGKLGRDVKTLVLLSPQYNFKGLRITPDEVRLMRERLAVLIIVGMNNASAKSNADRLHDSIEVSPKDADKRKDEEKGDPHHPLYYYDTELQGSHLLREEVGGDPASKIIASFLEDKLVKELRGETVKWQQRRTAFGLQPG